MSHEHLIIEQSMGLKGTVPLSGAKNAVLVIMASLIGAAGKSKLMNVPFSDDILQMIQLLEHLGASVIIYRDQNILEIDTSSIDRWEISPEIMRKMRASVLVMGPLLGRFSKAILALPGGCLIGERPIDYHLKAFEQMGSTIDILGDSITVHTTQLKAGRFILEYPSVGATENIMMAAIKAKGVTSIVNASLEPEVTDLISVLIKMGAKITIEPPATIKIEGVDRIYPIDHTIMYDRLEAGSLLLAAAITQGELTLPQAPIDTLELFLSKLQEMGHMVQVNHEGTGLYFKATACPQAISFKTMPYPGFPTDLQAPMMAALCLASGTSIIHETVFENRLVHVRELLKMGAQITIDGTKATVKGVEQLYGASVIAPDIRASCALVLAGLAAQGQTTMTGVHHLTRGYQGFTEKLQALGAKIVHRKNC